MNPAPNSPQIIEDELPAPHLTTAFTPEPGPVSSAFKWHLLALLVLLLTLIPIIDNGSFAFPDEGLYAAQAQNLSEGSWASVRPGLEIDRDGEWTALRGSARFGDKQIPYARRPLYPVLLTPFWAVGGVAGGIMLSILGTWGAALCTALIAARLDRRAAIPTLWLVGVGSPLLVGAYLVVGHSLATAFSALLTLSVIAIIHARGTVAAPTGLWAATAVLSAVALTLLRTEGIIVVFALALALIVSTARWKHRRPHLDLALMTLGFGLAVVAAVTYRLNNLWARSITATAAGDEGSIDRQSDALKAAWYDLLRPWHPDNRTASAAMALVVIGSVVGPLVIRFLPRFRLLGIGLVCTAAIASVIRVFESRYLISGLLPTVPWIVIGLLYLKYRDLINRRSRVLCLAGLIAITVILITSYGIGGSMQWGGRFYHVLLPMFAPLALIGILRLRTDLPRVEWRVIATSIVVMTLAIAFAGLRANAYFRRVNQQLESFITELAKSHRAPVLFSMLRGGGTSRVYWRMNDSGHIVFGSENIMALPRFLSSLPANQDAVMLVTDTPEWTVDALIRKSAPVWVVDDAIQQDDEGLVAVILRRTDGARP